MTNPQTSLEKLFFLESTLGELVEQNWHDGDANDPTTQLGRINLAYSIVKKAADFQRAKSKTVRGVLL